MNEPTAAASTAAVTPQALYKQILAWERQRKKAVEAGSSDKAAVNALTARMRQAFAQLIVGHLEFSHQQAADSHLWKSVFYRVIEDFRKQLRHLEGRKRDGSAAQLKECERAFKDFLGDAIQFYRALFDSIVAAYNIEFARAILQAGVGQAAVGGTRGLTIVQKLAAETCYRCLICLGDLSRYAEQRERNTHFDGAERYYLLATALRPGNGNAHNQLAVLAFHRGDTLSALYSYYRSLAIENPFPTARENIKLLFQKRKKAEQTQGDTLGIFRQQFLLLHELHFATDNLNGKSGSIDQQLQATLAAFESCVVEKLLDIGTLVKVVGINWSAGLSIVPLCAVVLEKTRDWVDEKSSMPYIVTLRLLLLWLLGPGVDRDVMQSATKFWQLLINSVNAFAVAASELPMKYGGGAFEEDRMLLGCTAMSHAEEMGLFSFESAVVDVRGERILSCIALARRIPDVWPHVECTERDGILSLALSGNATFLSPQLPVKSKPSGFSSVTNVQTGFSSVTNVSTKELAQYDQDEMEDVLKMTNPLSNLTAQQSTQLPRSGNMPFQLAEAFETSQPPFTLHSPFSPIPVQPPPSTFTHPWQLLNPANTAVPQNSIRASQQQVVDPPHSATNQHLPIGPRSSTLSPSAPTMDGNPLAWLNSAGGASRDKSPSLMNPFQLQK